MKTTALVRFSQDMYGDELTDDISRSRLRNGGYETELFPDALRERSVPDYGYNVLTRDGSLYEPVIDDEHLREGGDKPEWPDDSEFAVCLTHDLDHVSAHSLRQTIRSTASRVKAQWRLRGCDEPTIVDAGVSSIVRSVARGGLHGVQDLFNRGPDPYHCLEQWCELEREVGARSTFFVLPPPSGPAHVSDPEYRPSDTIVYDGERRSVASVLRELSDEGWEIGLHPTWYTFDDPDALLEEKRALEDAIGVEIKSVRHHWLHYDPETTPGVHEEVGFSFDSTLGFNGNVGFRRGTSYPWFIHDQQKAEQTSVLELPLIVQDGALFKGKGLGVDKDVAFEYVKLLAERVRAVGGVLTLLWHPASYVHDEWWALYKQIVSYLDEQNAWFGSVQDIGNYWLDNGITTG